MLVDIRLSCFLVKWGTDDFQVVGQNAILTHCSSIPKSSCVVAKKFASAETYICDIKKRNLPCLDRFRL